MAATLLERPSLPRRLGWRTVGALFAACVGLMLGAVPGWTMCFAAWLVVSWLVLCPVFLATLLAVARLAIVRRWSAWRAELRQLASVGVLLLAMLPMYQVSTWVELAQVRGGLRARAAASARAGGPRVATTPMASLDALPDGEGFVYDPDGVLAMSPERRPAAWNSDPVVLFVTNDCRGIRHFVGQYYRWNNACDGGL